MPNGFTTDGTFDFGGFFDGLLGTLAAVVAAILEFLQSLIGELVQALNFLLTGILDLFGVQQQGLGFLSGEGHTLWDQAIGVDVLGAVTVTW